MSTLSWNSQKTEIFSVKFANCKQLMKSLQNNTSRKWRKESRKCTTVTFVIWIFHWKTSSYQKSGALKICDLGVARDMSSTFISTNHGLFRPGKLMYMSPECSNLEEFDGAKSDVYSLGILLFCMLFGFNPYTAESTLKFREFQSRLASTSGSSFNDELLVDEYTEHLKQLQSTKQISIEDLAYGSILCDDADVIFDLYNIRDEVSDLAQDLICSMLCQESQRLSIEAVLQHPWLEQ
eukprot:TRINITY_DN18129_c0_g1_i1.p1 TRINITY_DN18129_c0_g1~~TRINITY_DN18129_c0_g1_i1.p1  ORF type:complete len:237 (-),score=52.07 TRINITY_DN18129_c0_g1_i1:50-760(-)